MKIKLITVLISLVIINSQSYSLTISSLPTTTIMEYTNESDVIVYGEILGSAIMAIEPETLCHSKIIRCNYLKGNGKDSLDYYNKSFLFYSIYQNDCRSFGPVSLLFLKLYKDTLFVIKEITLNDNKVDIINTVKSYISIEKMTDTKEKEKACCSLMIDLLKNDSLRTEALYCLWNGTRGKAEKGRETPIFYEDCFSEIQKKKFVKITQMMSLQDEYELNAAEIAFKYDKKKISKKLFTFLSVNSDCDTNGLNADQKEDLEYSNIKRVQLQFEIISFLCQSLSLSNFNEPTNAYRKERDCFSRNKQKMDLIKVLKKAIR